MVASRLDDEVALQILHLRDTTDLTAEHIGRRVGKTRSAVLGIVKRIRDEPIAPCECLRPENRDGGMPPRWWSR